ncbi:Lar family restriction alleviation protein, partial [Desulfovibrio sp. OttesenSCG-928-G15]|nr:Lar family restriction alleviation protein [Desulfovibrio sp. OttesenSCG-928-G15]
QTWPRWRNKTMNNPDLMPCPWCAPGYPETVERETGYCVMCAHCCAEGPPKDTREAAIAAWNRRAPGWKPMDTAPKDGTWILACRSGGKHYCQIVHWNEVFEEWSIKGSGVSGLAHWMPLPAAPEGE